MNDIVNIGVEHIHPHPENPRKDLGDLTELVESIKKNGVMQNLTVIPLEGKNGEYTAIIGHRRHAAAKLAGIKELPCRIIEGLSEKEQISAMLEENMQRNDLTIWEQANGFQMMLDLGDTEEQIAEKTGFSKTTIRHRLNIAKLDQEELKKKEQNESFQLTLSNLYALEKVEDIAVRNKILKEATSSRDLIWKAQSAADDIIRTKRTKEIILILEAAGIIKAPDKAKNEQYSGKWETVLEYSTEKDVPKKLKVPDKEKDTLYYLPHFRAVKVIKKVLKKNETTEDKIRKEKEKKKKQIKEIMKEMDARKKDFISNIITGKIEPIKEDKLVQEEIWNVLVHINVYLSLSNMRKFFTAKCDYDCTKEEKAEGDQKIKELSVLNQMLLMLNYALENIGDIYDWQGYYNLQMADRFRQSYSVLEKYGWSFRDEEIQLLDGTHELYEKKNKNEDLERGKQR